MSVMGMLRQLDLTDRSSTLSVLSGVYYMVAIDTQHRQGMGLLRKIDSVLPLRKRFWGLPNFGLVAGIFSVFLVITMTMSRALPGTTPRGLPVRLLGLGSLSQNGDPWTGPLVVNLRDAGPGQTSKLYVNSKPVVWEEFEQVPKHELGRRRVWVVHVGGDGAVVWQDVANVIDVAHGEHATVYLINAKPLP